MNNALSLATVTAILKNLLENSLIQQAAATGIGDVAMTALPPDRIAVGVEERPQLNLYLYRLTPNTRWRSTGQPATRASQQEQALVLNLHYLLSAYSERDFQAEILLGTALDCLQTSPCLSDEQINTLLASLTPARPGYPILQALLQEAHTSPLQEIRITPEFLSLEDLSKLWSSLQAPARPSVTYQVAVTLSTAHNRQLQTTHTQRR